MKLSYSELHYFRSTLQELMPSPYIQEMQSYVHHGQTSCLEHCLFVAYFSYFLTVRLHLNLDSKSIIRGALLHDFFLYDWHIKGERTGLHGFSHPRAALKNAEKYFSLNDKEKDIILNHMWPLTLRFPRFKESYIVSLADKYCSILETLKKVPPSIMSLQLP